MMVTTLTMEPGSTVFMTPIFMTRFTLMTTGTEITGSVRISVSDGAWARSGIHRSDMDIIAPIMALVLAPRIMAGDIPIIPITAHGIMGDITGDIMGDIMAGVVPTITLVS